MIFGMGTGRCGTKALADLLGVTHEKYWLSWDVNENLLSHYLPVYKNDGGNVSLCLLNYTGLLHEAFPDAKFVCLQRDMEPTARSRLRRLNGRNVWGDDSARAAFHYAYPYYPGVSIEQAARDYWREYYHIAHGWQIRLPEHFRIFSTAYGLGEGMPDLLDFCGYEMKETA